MQAAPPRFAPRSFCLGVTFFACAAALHAQASPPVVPTYDGGTRQVLESIFIPPMAHAPFSLTLNTEWSRPIGNGGTYTLVNQRRIMRDGAGRIYQERWMLIPKNGTMKSEMDFIQISNPADHTLYNCQIDIRKCFLLPYTGSTAASYQPAVQASAALPNNTGYHQHEELGHNDIAGVDTVGYRETTTLNPGVFGNDRPMVTTREFWYSPQLGINLLSRVDAPRSGVQLFTATDLSTSEPEPQLFVPPEGFAIVDQRNDAAAHP